MGLRSLEDGYVPPILDVSKLDRKVLVSNEESIAAVRALLDREGIFAGVSAGAVVHVARKLAAELDEGVVVCVLADGGWKYLSRRLLGAAAAAGADYVLLAPERDSSLELDREDVVPVAPRFGGQPDEPRRQEHANPGANDEREADGDECPDEPRHPERPLIEKRAHARVAYCRKPAT